MAFGGGSVITGVLLMGNREPRESVSEWRDVRKTCPVAAGFEAGGRDAGTL